MPNKFQTTKFSDMSPLGQDLYRHAVEVLHYDWTAEQPHAELLDWVAQRFYHLQRHTDVRDKSQVLIPRNCLKTSDVTINGSIKLLEDDPNLAILIGTHTHDYTKQILEEIKWHFERNEDVQDIVGNVHKQSRKWAEDAITLSTRTVNKKEPSIDTCALDKPKVGGHYDVIIIDDLHTRENITPKLLRKARQFDTDLKPLLKPGGVLMYVGTRWHHQDIFGYLQGQDKIRQKRGEKPQYKVFMRGCYDGPNGLYFPSILTKAFLDELRTDMTDKEFACQYLNQPIEEGASVFPPTVIQWFDGDYVYNNGLYTLRVRQDVDESNSQ